MQRNDGTGSEEEDMRLQEVVRMHNPAGRLTQEREVSGSQVMGGDG